MTLSLLLYNTPNTCIHTPLSLNGLCKQLEPLSTVAQFTLAPLLKTFPHYTHTDALKQINDPPLVPDPTSAATGGELEKSKMKVVMRANGTYVRDPNDVHGES